MSFWRRSPASGATPSATVERVFASASAKQLASELASPTEEGIATQFARIDRMTGLAFEVFVAACLRARGFHTENIAASGDFGVDIIARKGRTRWAVQVKRYRNKVSRTAVSDAVAGKHYWKCQRAWVITNSYFTKDAITLAQHTDCRLSDRDTLRRWLMTRQRQARGWRISRLWGFGVALIIGCMVLFGASESGARMRQWLRGHLDDAPSSSQPALPFRFEPQP